MAQMVRNDSVGVISSLQMDYGDSDEDEYNSSRNTSTGFDKEEEKSETLNMSQGEGEKKAEAQSEEEKITEGGNLGQDNVFNLTSSSKEASASHRVQMQESIVPRVLNIAPDVGSKEAEASPSDFISDDEEGEHPRRRESQDSHHHPHQQDEAKASTSVMSEAVSTDSPSSQPSAPKKAAMSRLVSYGPDEDLDDEDETDSDSEQEAEIQEVHENSPAGEPADTAFLSRSVQNMSSDDIKIPPEPAGSCSQSLQRKIEDMYDRMRKEGLDLNRVIQSKKNFRNPSIYEKLIEFCHIDEKGTNFPPEIYDPHIWGKESFYDELDKVQRKDMERREREKKEKTKIEFVTGTKKSSSESSSYLGDEKKRKTKWDAQPSVVSIGVVKQPSLQGGPGVVNLTSTATGTKATVISAVGSLSKKGQGK